MVAQIRNRASLSVGVSRAQETSGHFDLKILSGTANPELAREVAEYLELSVSPVKIQPFSDGEIYVQLQESVRGVDCFVVQSTCSPVNEI